MNKTIKVFPIRLDLEKHQKIKEAAENSSKSMHQFILDCVDYQTKEMTFDEYKRELLKKAYRAVKGGPDHNLENELFEYLTNNE